MRTWPALLVGASSIPSDLLQAALLDYDVSAIEELTPDSFRAFFSLASTRDAAAVALREQFPECSVECVDVADDDWAARSQANLHAIQVGRIIVAPPWDLAADLTLPAGPQNRTRPTRGSPTTTGSPTTDGRRPGPVVWTRRDSTSRNSDEPILIVIQPSMGFGTGHHATTRLCLDALQDLDLHGCVVIDIGTGSGILAIAARRLGAARVLGIDDDGDAIQAARESAALNEGADVTLEVGDFRTAMPGLFDLVLANLTGGLLASAAAHLQDLTAPRGRLILSGFMEHEEEDVLRGFKDYAVERRAQEDEWICVTLARSE